MDAILQWDISLNLAFQQLSPALDDLMKALSFLGQEEFYVVLIPFLYWCIDPTWGIRLLSVLVLSDFTNGLFKWLFHAPRPYWIDARVKALAIESSYGLPSGHAQSATAVWGYVASKLKKPWVWMAAATAILGISISRTYLGVHFLSDVLGGWVIGAIALVVFLWAESSVARWLKLKSIGFQIGTAFIASMIMLSLMLIVSATLTSVIDPPGWATLGEPIDPRNPEGLVTEMGIVFGGGAGLALMRRTSPFAVRGPWLKRIVRFALGVVVLLALRFGLGALFPREPLAIALAFRYLRYALMLLWAIWLAPWVFIKLKLADSA